MDLMASRFCEDRWSIIAEIASMSKPGAMSVVQRRLGDDASPGTGVKAGAKMGEKGLLAAEADCAGL